MTLSEYMSKGNYRPVMVSGSDASDEPPDGRLLDRIREFRNMDDRVCEYIPSGYRTPDYGKLKGGKLDYYLFWRNGVRDGRFTTTDRGYMWLYLCELVNDDDRSRALDTVIKLHEAYGDDDRESLIGSVALYIADTGDLDIPSTSIKENMSSIGRVLHQMCDGRDGYIDRSGFEMLSTIDGKSRIQDFDDVCTEIANRSLRELNHMVEARNRSTKGICGYYRLGPFDETLNPPYRIPTGRGRVRAKVHNAFDPYFMSDIRELMKYIVTVRKSTVKKTRPRPNTKTIAGVQFAPVVNQVAKKVISELPPDEGKVIRKAPVRLDRDAVDMAERDLRDVTEMMSTDVEGNIDVDETVISESMTEGSDPWQSFASSLTQKESDYLTDCLKCSVIVDIRLEDSINAKAMDSLEDTIVSDGRIFDDYSEDIRMILKG
ncbi:MAG: TerB N-terminal domain-containing protein, partial [Candidatus Methanomethylophilaceae archaeon]